MMILFENETQLTYNNSRIICCDSGLTAKNIDRSLSVSGNCLLFVQNNYEPDKTPIPEPTPKQKSKTARLALLFTGLSIGMILIILAIIFLVIFLKRKKEPSQTIAEAVLL